MVKTHLEQKLQHLEKQLSDSEANYQSLILLDSIRLRRKPNGLTTLLPYLKSWENYF